MSSIVNPTQAKSKRCDLAQMSPSNGNGSSSKCVKEQGEDFEKESTTLLNVEHSRDKASCNDMKNGPNASRGSETNLQKRMGDSKPMDKSTESVSDSNQLNKIEMVLQRIKGYISTVDDDNENVVKDASDLKESAGEEDPGEKVNEKDVLDTASKSTEDDSKKKETEELSILSGLMKTKTLPSIEIPTVTIDDDSEKDKAPGLDVVKKNDSFSLKLIETIQSCKAKLGLSFESELDKIDSGDSESLDEDDENDEDEDEDDEEQEGEEDMSGDGQKHGKDDTSASDDASDESSESDEELNSHSSETDIETIDDADGSLMKGIETEHHESVPDGQEEETENKLACDKDKAEKHSDATNALNVTERTSPEKEVASEAHLQQQSANENSTEIIDCDFLKESSENPSLEDKEVDVQSTVLDKDSSDTSEDVQRNKPESEAVSLPETLTPTDVDKDHGTPISGEKNVKNSFECEKMDEDDEIFICPPVKPPTPPLICLDDGTETEPEGDEKSESDSNFKNSSANHFPKQVSPENAAKLCSVFGIPKVPTSARKSMKRVFKSPTYEEESSDDDFRVAPSSQGLPLSGAKRTFYNRDKNNSGGMPNSSVSHTATNGTHQPNEIRAKEQISSGDEPNDESNLNGIANILNKEPLASVEDSTQNSVPESSDTLNEKDAELFNLKKKLGTLFSAFQLQYWKHNQEKAELRHNMNLIVMEMRASLEADKKQVLETLSRTFERENSMYRRDKKKQWLVLAPAKSDILSGPLQPKLVPSKLDNSESTESQNALEKKGNNSVSLLKPKSSEGLAGSENNESKKEETNLEEIYFPSPPGISFEGLDTALPDDNIQFPHLKDSSEGYSSDTEQVVNEKMEDSSAEEDLNWSDVDDTDNELVNIGRGVEILAKYLNKCLIYGQSAKRLTRCLIDVIFPDIKLLASCSAFGNKSNVTKLTRAALPARKVEAIIDFVLKRFPEATRSEIVLAINMKCKEARNIVGKTGSNGNVKKTLFRRLLAKEQSMEANLVNESNPSAPKPPTTVTLVKEPSVNVVYVPSSSLSESTSSKKTILPKSTTLAGPNIMRCNPQILIRPKSGLTAVGPRLLVSPSAKLVRDPTKQLPSNVRPLISGQKYGGKILVPIEVKKPSGSELPSHQNKQRPYIIIGSPASALPSAVPATQMKSEQDRVADLRTKRAEYMRNYRRAQRERQTDEEANQHRAAEALRLRKYRQFQSA
ncbi:hypothetical protein AVEN_261717-1 [Araneus ventricosus]|uniref:BEN domain-containing protein n=1 Tax=Araneus ventricosus TaxID=182803 RepID=A0A4Y2DXR7_ARAVE|nr:hypothetical protein AVEN_261717-1 [Araneus ventricosus]